LITQDDEFGFWLVDEDSEVLVEASPDFVAVSLLTLEAPFAAPDFLA